MDCWVLLTGNSIILFLRPFVPIALEKMASRDAMTESRVQALTALLPRIETRISAGLQSFKTQLEKGTKYGFLTGGEMSLVFTGNTPVEHVRALFEILKGKDNASFHAFCSILEANEYGHWSSELQMKVSAFCLSYFLNVFSTDGKYC